MLFIPSGQRPSLPPLDLRRRTLHFGHRVYVMGILNTTPDSFSDGGAYFKVDDAIARAQAMIEAGADIVDIGGESTRPDAPAVSVPEELSRTIPVVSALREKSDTLISIDTSKSQVAEAALKAGADIVNDVTALADPEMAAVIAQYEAAAILMHMRGTPQTMQTLTHYDHLIADVSEHLVGRCALAETAGIPRSRIVIDPGIGFAKTPEQNFEILRELHRFTQLQLPILVGPSRKSFLQQATKKPASKRLFSTAAAVTASVLGGADIVRVHDVEEMIEVVRTAECIAAQGLR